MVTGWRKAFCTTVPKDGEIREAREKQKHSNDPNPNPSPRFGAKFSFFSTGSNPSTPRLQSHSGLRCRTTTTPATSAQNSPRIQCKTAKSPGLFQCSNPSSPKSPSSFSLLKASLKLSKSRCGICIQSVKTGQGTAIFTAECSHAFHFPCIAAHVRKHGSLVCPVCCSNWKEVPLLAVHEDQKPEINERRQFAPSDLKAYDDDEPLMSPTTGARFIPIPESDENEEEEANVENVDVRLLPEAAVVSVGRSYETYVAVLKVKAPPVPATINTTTSSLLNPARRAPIDLVTVLDVGGGMTGAKLQMMKRAMRLVISSLSSTDRLSIVAFSASSKRLMPLKRMTTTGRRSARRIIESLIAGQGTSAGEALKKASKVLEDRRERNPVASIMLLSDGQNERVSSKSTNPNRPSNPAEDAFAKCVGGLLSVVVQDLRVQLGFASGSAPAEIAAVYCCTGRPNLMGSGSVRLGDLYAEDERELLVELKVPTSAIGAHHVLSVRCSYKDPSSQQLIYGKEQALLVPRPHAVRSAGPHIERLRNLYITTRAVAESRRLVEHNDISAAHHLLSSARALLIQQNSKLAQDFLRGLEAELTNLHWRRQHQLQIQRPRATGREAASLDEKGEPLTPTSAWRAAERLAKVAIMRKSLNRVSDLHGFENARF
ncbi:unnamed protein product, partial [Vitis vinifera]|uniref:Uncharacterized protein n=1 Tax=Vitis vinifera TaxID=29760 RepID=D7SSI6_VITVI